MKIYGRQVEVGVLTCSINLIREVRRTNMYSSVYRDYVNAYRID